ncbi:MAG: hypothetical protein ACE5GW_06270 [Planctomycetota bacterium]
MSDDSAEKRFSILSRICRAQHFAWREAVANRFPDADPSETVHKMWEITGRDTADAYLKRLDSSAPLAPQVAECIAWSSRSMGEDARAEAPEGRDEAFVRHLACPWFEWHGRHRLLEEDRSGCDCWFQHTVRRINERLGASLRVETLKTLPDGDDCCLRRIWVE